MQTVYLNHAGTSWPKPIPVQHAVSEAMASDPGEWPQQFEAAHQAVARFFHIPDESRLLLTPGCTSALSVAIADHPWTSGDRVLTSGLEHHALHRPLLKLQEQGVEVEVIPGDRSHPILLESLIRSLRTGSVRMVAVTAACNVSGELLPIEEIVEIAHRHGAIALVDGAQIAGWWDLNLPSLGVDLFAFAGHKGLQAPWGIGGLYVSPDLRMTTPGATCSVINGKPLCTEMPGYCDTGSVDRIALAGLAAAVQWLSAPAQASRLQHARDMVSRLQEEVENLPGAILYGPKSPLKRMPTVAFTVNGLSPTEVADRLAARGVMASAGLQCAPLAHETLRTAPEGVVRLSLGPETTEAHAQKALSALRKAIRPESISR